MGVVAKILTALAAALPAIVEWWAKRRAAQEQAAVEDRIDDIRCEPGPEWMRKFGAADQQRNEPADSAGADQPDSNPGGRNHDG